MYNYTHVHNIYHYADIKFSQTIYRVDENNGLFHAVLVLSNPSSADITVEVQDNEGSAAS